MNADLVSIVPSPLEPQGGDLGNTPRISRATSSAALGCVVDLFISNARAVSRYRAATTSDETIARSRIEGNGGGSRVSTRHLKDYIRPAAQPMSTVVDRAERQTAVAASYQSGMAVRLTRTRRRAPDGKRSISSMNMSPPVMRENASRVALLSRS
jgi:hypothetical protein